MWWGADTCSKHTQIRVKKSIAETRLGKKHFGRQSPCEVPERQFQLCVRGLWQELLVSEQPGFGFTAAKTAQNERHKPNSSSLELKLISALGLRVLYGDSEQGRNRWPCCWEKPLLVPGKLKELLHHLWNRSLSSCCQLHPLPALLGVGAVGMMCWDRRQGWGYFLDHGWRSSGKMTL